MSTRVAVLDDYQRAAEPAGPWHLLPDAVSVEFFHDHVADESALARRLEPFEIVVAMRERTAFPASLLDRLPNLRLLVTTGPSNAVIDVDHASQRGVVVCGTGGSRVPGSDPTAELTWGLILASTRHIAFEDRGVRAGEWQRTVGTALHGKILGLLGLGHIGSAVASVGRAFGMQVVAWSPNLTATRAQDGGAKLVSKDDLFRRADVLSVHLVLSDRTRGIVGAGELSLMKPTAYLVNTSRGPLISEPALVAALEEGKIAGAGLDVFDPEPLGDGHPFRTMDNVVLTPHLGYVTRETYDSFFGQIVEDINAFLAGSPVRVVGSGAQPRERDR